MDWDAGREGRDPPRAIRERVNETNEMQTEQGPFKGLRRAFLLACMAVGAFSAGTTLGQDAGKFDPSDIWFRAFTLLQDGMKAEEQGRSLDALSKYNESKPLFDGLAREFPEFHPQLVEYRRTLLVQKLAGLRDRMRQTPGATGQPMLPPNQAFGPAQPDPGIVGAGVVDVQPISPEFGPAGAGDGSVQLPQWQPSNPNAPASPTVIRPPVDGSVVQSAPSPSPGMPQFLGTATNSSTELATPEPGDNPFMRIQQDFDRMRSEIDRLAKKNKELETDLAFRKSELFDSQSALAESQRRAADLQKRLQVAEKLSKTDPNVEAEVGRLKQILNEALSELEKANQEKQELLAQLNSTQSELERIKAERDEIEKERGNLQAIMDGGGESVALTQLMADNRGLQEKLKQVEESAKSLEKENRDKTVEIALLKEQVDQIKADRQKLIDDNKRYEGHILDLRNRLKELGQELTEQDLAQVTAMSPQDAQESLLLRQIVLKQLRRQTQVMRTKELLLKELDKLGAEADGVYAMVEDMASGPRDLTEQEKGFFKTPEMLELAEAAGVEQIEGIIMVEANGAANPSGAAIMGNQVTQKIADELTQIQKSARLDFIEGRYEEAEKSYRDYLSHRPKSVICLCNLALVKMATKKHGEAQELLEKAVAIKGDYGLAYYLLGRNFFQQGRLDEALERLNESIHYDPANPKAFNCVGVISSQKGFVNRAEDAFSEAVKLDPEFGDAHFNLAVIYATREKPDPNRAAEHYNRAMLLGVPRDNAIEGYLDAAKSATATVSMR
jgi:Tfp pilus assembly protein PilF/predicted nuclease with TOPRIM domain